MSIMHLLRVLAVSENKSVRTPFGVTNKFPECLINKYSCIPVKWVRHLEWSVHAPSDLLTMLFQLWKNYSFQIYFKLPWWVNLKLWYSRYCCHFWNIYTTATNSFAQVDFLKSLFRRSPCYVLIGWSSRESTSRRPVPKWSLFATIFFTRFGISDSTVPEGSMIKSFKMLYLLLISIWTLVPHNIN